LLWDEEEEEYNQSSFTFSNFFSLFLSLSTEATKCKRDMIKKKSDVNVFAKESSRGINMYRKKIN